MSLQLRPGQLATLLSQTIQHGLPILITGAPGVGKSDIISQAAIAAEADIIISHPAVSDPTDFKGLPWPSADKESATFLPFGELSRAINATRPTVWFLDDLGQAAPSVQASCFPAGTPIATVDGYKSIEDVREGDRVVDQDGICQKVTHCFQRHTQGMIKIRAVGLLPINATEEHPILVIRDGRKRSYKSGKDGKYAVSKESFGDEEWIPAGDVKAGDWISVPIPKGMDYPAEMAIATYGFINKTMVVNAASAKLIGYYVGDGWFVKHKAVEAVSFALDDKYPEIQEELIRLLGEVTGKHVFVSQKKNYKRISVHDRDLGLFLAKVAGDRSEVKRIPDFILFNKDKSVLTAFLQGYLATDGARLKSGDIIRGVQWGTVSRALAYQLQLALTRYGTLAPMKLHCKEGQVMASPRTGKEYPVRNAYVIQCSDKRVIEALGEHYTEKRDVCYSFERNGRIWTRVRSVEAKSFEGTVYNLEVENSHTYTAHNAVVHNCMQLLLARRVNGHVLPDCVTFVAATNRRTDRAGVSGILEPVKSRFATIVELQPTLDDWCHWALGNGLPVELVAFLRFRPDLLHAFSASADLTNSPSPRTWHSVAKLMKIGLPKELEYPAFAGAVGEGAATELVAFLRVFRELPNIDAILLNPDSQEVPSQPSVLYATSASLASRANETNFGRVARYCERMLDAGFGEFGAMLIRDAQRITPAITNSPAFVTAMCGSLGKLISGNVS